MRSAVLGFVEKIFSAAVRVIACMGCLCGDFTYMTCKQRAKEPPAQLLCFQSLVDRATGGY